ncbi:MAG: DUF2971 domain-containing protein [Proteobacteria bacterium]|nr:DUF2971 domain-containing protein [Pseudomonadota bacterium]
MNFNDPFDIQNELTPDFNLNDFPDATMKVVEQYVKNDYPMPNAEDGFSKAILIMREKSKTQGYKKAEIEAITYPLLGHLLGEVNFLISQVNSHWHNSMRDSRVFCVTENNDNLLMWAHYAKDHTGAVFQLATLPESDTPLSVAKKVKYKEKPVRFYSLDELIKWTLFDIEPDPARLQFSNHAYRKSKIWRYEEEWRVVDMCHYENKNDLYVDHKFIPQQLQKIFFGCKANSEDISRLRGLAENINPQVEFYKAKKLKLEYALGFEKI